MLPFLLAFILNFLRTFIGISIIIYSAYLLNQWNKHSLSPLPSASSPFYPDALLLNFDAVKVSDLVTPLNLAAGVLSNIGDGLNLCSHELPAPWFIYAFMGTGVVLCCISCIGHIAAEAINGCCLCFWQYTLLNAVLIVLEGAMVAFIAVDRHWEKDLPFDPTGDLHSLHSFIEANADVFKWVGISIVIIQYGLHGGDANYRLPNRLSESEYVC